MDGWKLEDDPFLLRWSFFFSGANFCSIQEAVAGCFFLPVPFGFSYLGVGPYLRSATDGGRLLPSSLQCRRSGRKWGIFFFHPKKKGFPNKKLGGIAKRSNHVTQINKDITKISKMYGYTPSEGVWYFIITRRWLSPLPGEVVQFDLRIFLKGVET